MKLVIGHLYSSLMNTYGDDGNVLALQKRAQWRGIEVEIKKIGVGDKLPGIDLYFFGGGQDQAQEVVAKDLLRIGTKIKEDVEKGTPLLSICGGYQLLGEYYQPFEGERVKGVGLFPVYTEASNDRMIGNIVIEVMGYGFRVDGNESHNHEPKTHNLLVGFENHSGKTYLKEDGQALGKIIKGFGNNGEDKTEGCIYKNAIGTYMHGSLLPKNPQLADFLIQTALEVKYQKEIKLEDLDDSIEQKAHNKAISLFS